MRSLIIMLLALTSIVTAPACTNEDAKQRLQTDTLVLSILNAFDEGDFDNTLEMLDDYRSKTDNISLQMLFIDAEASAAVGDYLRSGARLKIYLDTADQNRKNYEQAVHLSEDISVRARPFAGFETDPGDAPAFRRRANAYAKIGQYDLAIRDYNKVIQLKPKMAKAYAARALAYFSKKYFDQAIRDFDRAIELKPEIALTYTRRGRVYSAKKDYDRAISDYDQAIERNPKSALTYTARGNAYFSKKRFDLAIQDYTTGIELDPEIVLAYANRGNTYISQNQYDLAIRDYDRVIELNPESASTYSSRGLVYFYKNQYDPAIRDYSRAIELDPTVALTYGNRGKVYASKGQYNLAIRDYNEAIELDPRVAFVYNNVAWIRATSADKQYRNGVEAIQHAVKANELSRWINDGYLDTLAASYAEAGTFEKAIETQAKAIALLSEQQVVGPDHGYRKRLALFQSGVPFRMEK